METLLWDRDEVLFQIRRRYQENLDLSYSGVLEDSPRLLFAAVHYFKNWGVAITSAGIDYNKVRRVETWSREKIKRELKRLKRKGVSFRYNEFEKGYPKLLAAACYHLGSWQNAVGAVGIDYQSLQRFTTWNRQKVKRRIRSLYRKGKDISYSALEKNGKIALLSAGSYYFANWGKAVLAAGLPYAEIRRKRVGVLFPFVKGVEGEA